MLQNSNPKTLVDTAVYGLPKTSLCQGYKMTQHPSRRILQSDFDNTSSKLFQPNTFFLNNTTLSNIGAI